MDFTRTGQKLLRSQWLTSGVCRRTTVQACRSSPLTWHRANGACHSRAFSSSLLQSQQATAPAPKTGEEHAQPETNHPNTTDTPSESRPSQTTQRQTRKTPLAGKYSHAFDDLLDSYSQSNLPSGRNSADETQKAFAQSAKRPQTMFAEWGGGRQDGSYGGRRIEPKRQYEQESKFDDALAGFDFPASKAPDTRQSATSVNYDRSALQPVNYPRLTPNLGRYVEVKNGDVATALSRLRGLIIGNDIKGQSMRQRFHERGGLKRKRLKSERWRRRFRESFKYTTARVTRFVNQGW